MRTNRNTSPDLLITNKPNTPIKKKKKSQEYCLEITESQIASSTTLLLLDKIGCMYNMSLSLTSTATPMYHYFFIIYPLDGVHEQVCLGRLLLVLRDLANKHKIISRSTS